LDWAGQVDFAFCFSVIEHIQNPRVFLKEIGELLAPEGKLLLSTPNRRDILIDLKGETYVRFFYRTVHRWYFDRDSFAYCARAANLKMVESRCIQRFGLSNTMLWLRDGRPSGLACLPHLDGPLVDRFWKGHLESRGVGDYLYFKLVRA
jgi:SAM-dependent methyltransferase